MSPPEDKSHCPASAPSFPEKVHSPSQTFPEIPPPFAPPPSSLCVPPLPAPAPCPAQPGNLWEASWAWRWIPALASHLAGRRVLSCWVGLAPLHFLFVGTCGSRLFCREAGWLLPAFGTRPAGGFWPPPLPFTCPPAPLVPSLHLSQLPWETKAGRELAGTKGGGAAGTGEGWRTHCSNLRLPGRGGEGEAGSLEEAVGVPLKPS